MKLLYHFLTQELLFYEATTICKIITLSKGDH